MTLVINVAGVNTERYEETQLKKESDSKNSTGRFFAGAQNDIADPVALKRAEARQKAMKVVKDAWDNDKQVDASLEKRRTDYESARLEKEEIREHLEGLESDKAELKELYSVSEDSEEYRDLQLLEKRQNANAGFGEPLTKEEQALLKEIDKKPLTEYQRRSLELNEQALIDKKKIRQAECRMMDDVSDIRSILQERLKSHAMVDATKNADAILEAANDEIIGMLIEEAKEKIDEEMKEKEEQAEKQAEEQKEEEEKLEEIKETREWQRAVIEGTKEAVERAKAEERKNDAPDIDIDEMIGLVQNNKQSDDVKQSLEDIKSSMRLLEADLKGIEVDTEI